MASWAFSLDDTIAAISTPPGQGAIGIVRLSGPEAVSIANGLFRPSNSPAPRLDDRSSSHRLIHGWVLGPDTRETVDQILLAVMHAPHSFTGQDVVELQAHGGAVPLQEILRLALQAGARPAGPGEFTLRAYVNGRMDLAQAEAVMDVISARTAASLRVASRQLEGELSGVVRATRSALVELLAYLESRLDFVDDEIPERDVAAALAQACKELDTLLAQAQRGVILRQGVWTAIVGKPNVGKSSLLNRLLGHDRAIVTPTAGTTRDTLKESINLDGVPFVLVDTAGINDAQDPIERLGVERSQQAIAGADLVLVVVDGSKPLDAEDFALTTQIGERSAILVVNKADLPQVNDKMDLLPGTTSLAVSALKGKGMDDLRRAMLDQAMGGQALASQETLVSNPRHATLLDTAREHVADAIRAHTLGESEDILAIDVREAVLALGEITGEDASEDLLATIFSRFCVGK